MWKIPGVERLGGGRNGKSNLVLILSLFDEVLADLQLGFHESVDEEIGVTSHQLSCFGHLLHAVRLGLLLAALG